MNDNVLSETHFSTKFIQKSWLLLFVYVLNFLMTWFFESDHETSTKSVLLAFDWLLRWQPDQSEKQNKSNIETNSFISMLYIHWTNWLRASKWLRVKWNYEIFQLLSNKMDFKVFHRKRKIKKKTAFWKCKLFRNISLKCAPKVERKRNT